MHPVWNVRCRATAKRTGERCRKWAIHGGSVCSHHGGSAPQVRRVAAERFAAYRAERYVPPGDAAEVAQDAIRRAAMSRRRPRRRPAPQDRGDAERARDADYSALLGELAALADEEQALPAPGGPWVPNPRPDPARRPQLVPIPGA
jgi:hypothetical protein